MSELSPPDETRALAIRKLQWPYASMAAEASFFEIFAELFDVLVEDLGAARFRVFSTVAPSSERIRSLRGPRLLCFGLLCAASQGN